MSELTPCNRCTHNRMVAERPDLELRPAPDNRWPLARKLVDPSGALVAWFAELSPGCEC